MLILQYCMFGVSCYKMHDLTSKQKYKFDCYTLKQKLGILGNNLFCGRDEKSMEADCHQCDDDVSHNQKLCWSNDLVAQNK